MFEISFVLHDASRATGVPARTLEHFIKNGELPIVKIGRTRVIRRSALDAFLARYEVRVLGEGEERTSTGVIREVMQEASVTGEGTRHE
jgi:excisionase family DNA binding protein